MWYKIKYLIEVFNSVIGFSSHCYLQMNFTLLNLIPLCCTVLHNVFLTLKYVFVRLLVVHFIRLATTFRQYFHPTMLYGTGGIIFLLLHGYSQPANFPLWLIFGKQIQCYKLNNSNEEPRLLSLLPGNRWSINTAHAYATVFSPYRSIFLCTLFIILFVTKTQSVRRFACLFVCRAFSLITVS